MKRRRKRFPDRTSVGSSDIFPYRDRCWKTRHENRLSGNLAAAKILAIRSIKSGLILKIKNEGHHWMWVRREDFSGVKFLYGGKQVEHPIVEWWPSSAKMVCDKKWKNGVHVHDYEQAWIRVAAHFGKLSLDDIRI